jgi:hypothetical protein
LTEIEKAYIAGIVDGEGTVTLALHHKNETPGPYVSVANNNLELLEWIRSKADGCITKKRKNKPHHHDSYTWYVRHDRALRFLNEIKKYLIIKKPHADLITGQYKQVTHRTGKYTAAMLRKKMRLVAKIRALNQR